MILLSILHCVPIRAQSTATVEYQVKAAFLLNFARFVVWPPDAFENDQSPIVFCDFRQDSFQGALQELIQGKSIGDRTLLLRRAQDFQDLKACQIVFVGQTQDNRLPEILDALKGASALVVGESEGFAERGGGIQFYLQDNKLRFSVNVDATKRARLSVSSKLLALARIAHDQAPAK